MANHQTVGCWTSSIWWTRTNRSRSTKWTTGPGSKQGPRTRTRVKCGYVCACMSAACSCVCPSELGGSTGAPVLTCTAAGELEPGGFVCAPYVCPALDCWSLRSRERPRLQGVCPNCWYGCLDTGSPPIDIFGNVFPNPGTCTIGCRDKTATSEPSSVCSHTDRFGLKKDML